MAVARRWPALGPRCTRLTQASLQTLPKPLGPRPAGGSGYRSWARRAASSAAARCSAFACGVAARPSGLKYLIPPGDCIGVTRARLPTPDPVVDHDAGVLAFPLLGRPSTAAGRNGRARPPARIGVHLANDQVSVRVVGVVVGDADREVVLKPKGRMRSGRGRRARPAQVRGRGITLVGLGVSWLRERVSSPTGRWRCRCGRGSGRRRRSL